MSKEIDNKKSAAQQDDQEKEHSLKGAFASVMMLGAFIIVSWLAVFLLFIERN